MPTPSCAYRTTLQFCWLFICAPFLRPAGAHDVLSPVVEHRVECRPGPRAIDFDFTWSLRGEPALAERQRMDSDADGEVSASEEERYVRFLRQEAAAALSVFAGAVSLPLVPFYDLAVDLEGSRRVSTAPFVARARYFARWPRPTRTALVLDVVDELWNDSPALFEFASTGLPSAGFTVEALGGALRTMAAGHPRRFCLHLRARAAPPSARGSQGPWLSLLVLGVLWILPCFLLRRRCRHLRRDLRGFPSS